MSSVGWFSTDWHVKSPKTFTAYLKGLSHEKDFKNFDKKFPELGLNKGQGWILNIPKATLFFNDM